MAPLLAKRVCLGAARHCYIKVTFALRSLVMSINGDVGSFFSSTKRGYFARLLLILRVRISPKQSTKSAR